jgi:hypothetical protein
MSVPAPKCDTSEASCAMHYVDNAGGASADLDLTTIATCPKWAPQKTTLWVDTTLAVIVLVDEDNKSHTISVSAGVPIVLTRPIRKITDTGTGDVNALFEWFDPNGSNDWNR